MKKAGQADKQARTTLFSNLGRIVTLLHNVESPGASVPQESRR
jgi:hypothetical protein